MALLVIVLITLSCTGARTAAPPASIHGILSEIARRGATATDLVSGDTGCATAGEGLAPNAFHFRVASTPRVPPADVYVFLFRTRQTFTAATPAIDTCAAAYAAAGAAPRPTVGSAAGGGIQRLAISPYHAFGTGWSRELTDLLRDALSSAAGDGGDPRLREPG